MKTDQQILPINYSVRGKADKANPAQLKWAVFEDRRTTRLTEWFNNPIQAIESFNQK